ncbi:hypothetical protein FB45DRAFT_918904 [Roridomyces roridus]|uniref:Uncharacterized protein n=1 Tax=Roridomyces roridus TaxID=1738132 RepID=A0AAD7BRP2_9AGAR|nr:hypothetical protein FB45DRAFT_918904 [Roridomyces roridus]
MQNQSFLAMEDPLDALCHHFSLTKALLPPNARIPPTFDMTLSAPPSRQPTHLFAILPPEDNARVPTLMIPVSAGLYGQSFAADLLPAGTALPVPHIQNGNGAQPPCVTLPVVPVSAPHSLSIPLVLLFGLGLETDRNLLAQRMLPAQVIGEFPHFPAMVGVMAKLPEQQFEWYLGYTHGMWKNVLALAPKDAGLVEFVQMAHKVIVEAGRLRGRR